MLLRVAAILGQPFSVSAGAADKGPPGESLFSGQNVMALNSRYRIKSFSICGETSFSPNCGNLESSGRTTPPSPRGLLVSPSIGSASISGSTSGLVIGSTSVLSWGSASTMGPLSFPLELTLLLLSPMLLIGSILLILLLSPRPCSVDNCGAASTPMRHDEKVKSETKCIMSDCFDEKRKEKRKMQSPLLPHEVVLPLKILSSRPRPYLSKLQ